MVFPCYHLSLSMIKEITLAIILGALLGFGITGGYLATQKSQKASSLSRPSPTTFVTPSTDSTPTITPTPEEISSTIDSQLTIDSPKDEAIVNNSLLEITGTSPPNSLIIVNTGPKHYQGLANSEGKFNVDVELDSGPNNVQIDSFDSQDNQSTVVIQVTYSTAKI